MENLPQAMIDAFIKGWSKAHRHHEYSERSRYETLATFARICPAIVPLFKQALCDEDAKGKDGMKRYFRSLENFFQPLSEPLDFVIDYLNYWCSAVSWYEIDELFRCIIGILRKRRQEPNRLWRMLIDGCLNDNSKIREEAFTWISIAIKDDVHFAMQAWEHLTRKIAKNEGQTSLFEEGCKRYSFDIRSNAIRIKLECCTALGHPLPIIEETFLTAMSDSSWLVRKDVIMHLEKLAQIGNAHATIAQKILVMSFDDRSSYVRLRAVMEAINICNVLGDRNLALKLLVKSCLEDNDSNIRGGAIEPLVKLITKEEDSENLMNVLEQCCSDEDSDVRRKVCDNIVDVVVRVPSLALSVLKMLKSRWNDEDHTVRYQVVKSLCDLCLNINPGDELLDVLSAESVDVEAQINEQVAVLKEQLKVFGHETDVRFFQFLLRRYIREKPWRGSLLENKIVRMAVIIEQSGVLMLDAVHESVRLKEELKRSGYDDRSGRFPEPRDPSASLLKLLVRSIQHLNETPAYASELMTLVLYLRDKESDLANFSEIIETVPIDYIFEYLLSNSDWSLDSDFAMRFMSIAVTVPDSCDNQSNGLLVYESSEEILIRKSREEMDYLVPVLKSIYPTLQSSQL